MPEVYALKGFDVLREVQRRESWLRAHAPCEAVWAELDRCHLPEKSRVVDLGCGIGVRAILTAQHPRTLSVDGIDIHPKLLGYARRRARRLGVGNVRFLVDDLRRTSLRSVYDLARLDSVLWTQSDPLLGLAEAHRLLVPGGKLLATNHDATGFEALCAPQLPDTYWRLHRHVDRLLRSHGANPRYGHRLASDAQKAGFVINEATIEAEQEIGPQSRRGVEMHWEFLMQWERALAPHRRMEPKERSTARSAYRRWARRADRSQTRLKYVVIATKR